MDTKKSAYEHIATMHEKLAALYREYEQSKIYETCKYHAIKYPRKSGLASEPLRYAVYIKENGKLLCEGSASFCLKYISRRKIDESIIYNFKILQDAKSNDQIREVRNSI